MRLMASTAISAASRNSARRKLRRGSSAQKLRSGGSGGPWRESPDWWSWVCKRRGEAYPRESRMTNPSATSTLPHPTNADADADVIVDVDVDVDVNEYVVALPRAGQLAHLEARARDAPKRVELGGRDQIDAGARARIGAREAEGDRLAGGAAVIERELQVILAHHARRPGRHAAEREQRLAVGNPERRQPRQLLGEAEVEIA